MGYIIRVGDKVRVDSPFNEHYDKVGSVLSVDGETGASGLYNVVFPNHKQPIQFRYFEICRWDEPRMAFGKRGVW